MVADPFEDGGRVVVDQTAEVTLCALQLQLQLIGQPPPFPPRILSKSLSP